MTAALLEAARGRPSVSNLQDSLDRARQLNNDLRDELRADRAEDREFAETVADSVRFIEAYYDRPQVVMQHAGRIGHAAERFLRQRRLGAHL